MLPQIIIASVCVIIKLYGLLKRNREFFSLGYFLFGLVVVPSEFSFFCKGSGTHSFGSGIYVVDPNFFGI